MRYFKTLFTLTLLAASCAFSAPAHNNTVTYGIHLFFNEKEFVDVLTLDKTSLLTTGKMHVPNDFDGDVENLTLSGEEISFDLLVPKNAARPEDLIFHYTGHFFDGSMKQITGFVTIKGTSEFVASFVGFVR